MTILTKITMWLVGFVWPRLLDIAIGYFEIVFETVEGVESWTLNGAEKRKSVLGSLKERFPLFPEFIHRGTIEAVLLLKYLGIDSGELTTAWRLVCEVDLEAITNADKRSRLISEIEKLAPNLPEKVARLLIEFGKAKLIAQGG